LRRLSWRAVRRLGTPHTIRRMKGDVCATRAGKQRAGAVGAALSHP
jgi:hypothetical protein